MIVAFGTSSSWKASRPRGARPRRTRADRPAVGDDERGPGPARTSSRLRARAPGARRATRRRGSGSPRRRAASAAQASGSSRSMSAQARPSQLAAVRLGEALVDPRLRPTAAPTISAVSRARHSVARPERHEPASCDRARRARAPARGRGRSAARRGQPMNALRRRVDVGLAVAGEEDHPRVGGRAAACRRAGPRRRVSSESTSAGGDVPEVDVRAVALDEPDLLVALRRLEDQPAEVDLVDDLVDQAGAQLAVGAVQAGVARRRGPRTPPASRRPRAPRGSAATQR